MINILFKITLKMEKLNIFIDLSEPLPSYYINENEEVFKKAKMIPLQVYVEEGFYYIKK